MPITIGSNIAALQAQRRLNEGSDLLTRIYERLSSGQRINRASDDAAGLAIASSLSTDQRLFTVALRNIGDGISALAIADAATAELSQITTRISELAEQAANGVYATTQRHALDIEAQALSREFSRIVQTTTFNGQSLLTGNSKLVLQVGVTSDATSRIDATVGPIISQITGTQQFSYNSSATATNRVSGFSLGDFNNDGMLDIVGNSDNGGGEPVFLSNGDGTFGSGTLLGGSGVGVATSDVNNDGFIDAIAEQGSNLIGVRLSNGNGTFKATTNYDGGANPNRLAVSDVSGDGYADIITMDEAAGTMLVQIGNGDGSFNAKVQYAADSTDRSLLLSDVNGDGHLDALVGFTTGFGVYLNNGNGTFGGAITFASIQQDAPITAADLNGDGKSDLISLVNTNAIALQIGNGNGTFNAITTVLAGVNNLVAADLNGDGIVDLAAISNSSSNGAVYLGNGNATFSSATSFALGSGHNGFSIRSRDANGDGFVDLFVGTYTGNTIDILLQNTTTAVALPSFSLQNAQSARLTLTAMSSARDVLARSRGSIGALMSRLEVAANVVATSRENTEAARARIIDADVASESAASLRASILQQVGSAVLAQANQEPALALQLLRG